MPQLIENRSRRLRELREFRVSKVFRERPRKENGMGKKKLTDIRIEFISLVENPANEKGIVFKSADDPAHNMQPEQTLSKVITISKSDEEKHLVFATVYEPDTVDSQGDFAEAGEIEKACHLFLNQYRQECVDTEHNQNPNGSTIVESFIKRGSIDEFPETKDGAWCVVIKIRDVEIWDKIKNGEITGVSMFGSAMKTEVEKSSGDANAESNSAQQTESAEGRTTIVEAINKGVESLKDFILGNEKKENKMSEEQVKKMIEEAVAPKDAEIAELKKAVEEQKAEIEELKKQGFGKLVGEKEDGGKPEPANSAF